MLKKIIIIFLLLCAVTQAQEERLLFTAETVMFQVAGMPDMQETKKQLDSIAIPSAVSSPIFQNAKKKFKIRFWSPVEISKDSTATIYPPTDLKLGEKIHLTLVKPGEGNNSESAEAIEEELSNLKINYFWGAEGAQGDFYDWDNIPDMQKSVIIRQIYSENSSLFYKSDYSCAYWPKSDTQRIAKQAKLAGVYRLENNYTTNIEVDIPENITFLEPFNFSSPDLSKTPSFEKPIIFRWKPIPNIMGFYAMILGTNKDGSITVWSSSESAVADTIAEEYPDYETIRKMVTDKIFMPAEKTEMKVPAKIFSKCESVFMIINGYGNEYLFDDNNTQTQVKTKTSMLIMLRK